ncbi:hypothetical protein [Herbaspirillum huttiense]|uniref:Uncharacterized protein n=1 Tax=Herbaspirillum huttiense subsp. lycopersici TaxID=3074428 RepID=A0ABU2EGS3_9BURK|nr:hypothetical protein [Herbaspirillum huttiense]MDR9847043.1 hypothetical protein [Herbaspirillum huttiense SE1]
MKVNTLDARCIMAVSSKKIHPALRQGGPSPSKSALSGSYRSKPAFGAAAREIVYRQAHTGIFWVTAQARSAQLRAQGALKGEAARDSSFSIKGGAESILAVDSASPIGSVEFKRALVALNEEVTGLTKMRPGFGMWADRKEDALEIEAELRGEWA